MTKPKYQEFYVNDTAFNDTMGLNYVALPKETRKWLGVRTIEHRALTDLQEQCDKLELALERLDAGFGGMFGGDGKDYYQDACDRGAQFVIEALAEYRKWKNNKGE